ncbi:phytanoyl-CoA dioxygenase PhyH [Paraburkholderia sp. BL18I3N2]|uniref:phytanoyl-CoA dioxygenase family protein n=1 Tax=unclassified Paraburkholderia TaxID=2615204 RepID=UPI000D065083|nr:MULTISPECIES: phytanoyl-CoA dioxygenase family protein [unclassified Paraburkholderia]PRX19195.1 phytanoyl-CoA dioxygenase PhyH [Paraburkholderia sp. BL18I3N2]PRX89423.1 phytanoyl-CoA dioxygenase PhyH [Paraburkholderia sp. BL25I1N1]REE07515.1 phytanoyl-CoA dioxygenase PhyH [Paraburkholderia sp. BL27I4N3]
MYIPELRPVVTLPSNTSIETIFEATQRDGAVIVANLISAERVRQINAELDATLDGRGASSTIAYDKQSDGLTRRLSSLVARSAGVVDTLLEPQLLGWAERTLDDKSLQLCSTQMLEVWPGAPAQTLHTDEGNWPPFLQGPYNREVQCCCLVALTDFTEENGATRVLPGTHRHAINWLELTEVLPSVPAEMKAGSALFFTGKVGHGAGANRSGAARRGMTLTFCPGWIRPGEAQCLSVSREFAKQLPQRMRELMGFRSFYQVLVPGQEPFASLWQYEIGDASSALEIGPIR